MHLKGLDLNLLVVLDALIAEKNITRAGERIYLSQSATSGALARLREFFGDPLLVQIGQRMELTPVAEELAQPVRELLLRGESIIKKNPGFLPESSNRTFRINMSDYSASVVMTRALSKIQQVAPGIRLEIMSIIEEPTIEYLDRGYLDVAILPVEQMSPLHPAEHLFDDRYVCLVWSGNKLVANKISLETYLSLGHIVARFGKAQNRSFNEVFLARAGYQLRVEVVVPSFSMQSTLIVGTNLIATIHERFARFYAQYMPLKVLPMPIALPPLQMNVQWHRYHNNDAGTKWLCGILREAAHEALEPDARNGLLAR